jgi:hypothetical protein
MIKPFTNDAKEGAWVSSNSSKRLSVCSEHIKGKKKKAKCTEIKLLGMGKSQEHKKLSGNSP